MLTVDFVVEGQGLVVVGHAEASLLADATGSYSIFDEAVADMVAREQLVHVESGATGAWVAHAFVVCLLEEDHGIRGCDGEGGEGLEGRFHLVLAALDQRFFYLGMFSLLLM